MESTKTVGIGGSALEDLRAGLKGDAYVPGDAGYDEARVAWNLNAHQHPALVVMAQGAADVLAAVRLARDEGLGVGVMATGHGVAAPADGGVLINTSRMKGVHVDPETRTARVEAGAKWADVVPEAAAHGLAGLQGSSSDVGVVGYTMGGGFGWLGRKHGFAADSVKEADVVTADGELLTASADEHPDLFWGLRGGSGNFGVVTSLEFKLHPVGPTVLGGFVFYPFDQAREVARFYREFTSTAPDELTTHLAFATSPDGHPVVAYLVCYSGPVEEGEAVLAPLRAFGTPLADTIGPVPYTEVQAFLAPAYPEGRLNYWKSNFLNELSDEAIQAVIDRELEAPAGQWKPSDFYDISFLQEIERSGYLAQLWGR